MARKAYLIIALQILFSSSMMAQLKLEVEVSDLRNNLGQVMMELFSEDNVSLTILSDTIDDNKCVITFENLQKGRYAVRHIHDENSNKDLDTNFFGMPKEGVGISNNAVGTFGPKDFEEWLIYLKGDTTITMVTHYL